MLGKPATESEVVFLMNEGGMDEGGDSYGGGYNPPNFRGLRSKTHTYAVAHDGKWLLYDNVNDPLQQHNLIGDPAQKPLTDQFDTLIAAWLKESGDPFEYAAAITKRSPEAAS